MRMSYLIYEHGDAINGPIVNQKRLLSALHERGHEIQVLCLFHESSPVHDQFREEGFATARYPAGKYTQETVLWILGQLQSFKPDIFVPDWIAPGAFAARWLRQAGVPTIGGLRSDDGYFWALMDVFARPGAGPWALSSVFCVSRELEQRLNENLSGSTRTCFIPSGVPFPANVPPKKPPVRMAYLGRIEVRQKQIIETVRAMCVAARTIEGVTGVLFGNGPDEGQVHKIIEEEGCSSAIRLEPPVPPQQLEARLRDQNVVVLLSDYEGTPGALMDGMANGLVPVCTDCGGGAGALVENGRTGFVIQDRREGFVEAIRQLSEQDGLLQEFSASSRTKIEKGFTISHTVRRWEELSETLLSRSPMRTTLRMPRTIRLPRKHPDLFGFDYRPPTRKEFFANKCRIVLGAFKKTLLGRN